jgi:hypothetical protein
MVLTLSCSAGQSDNPNTHDSLLVGVIVYVKKAIGALAFSAALLVGSTTAASAATHDSSDHYGHTGRCASDSVCLYYSSGESGAFLQTHELVQISDLAGYKFNSAGAGAGQAVKNNAASAENNLVLGCELHVFYNSNFGGNEDYLETGSYGQLYYTYNEDASIIQKCP